MEAAMESRTKNNNKNRATNMKSEKEKRKKKTTTANKSKYLINWVLLNVIIVIYGCFRLFKVCHLNDLVHTMCAVCLGQLWCASVFWSVLYFQPETFLRG